MGEELLRLERHRWPTQQLAVTEWTLCCDRAEPARQLRALLCIPFPAPMSRACHTIGSFPLGLPLRGPRVGPSGTCTSNTWKFIVVQMDVQKVSCIDTREAERLTN